MTEFWNLTETDLNAHFIAFATIYQYDNFKTIKAGSNEQTGIVRTLISEEEIRIVCRLSSKFRTNSIPCDGSIGIGGKICERTLNHNDELSLVETFFLHYVSPEDITMAKKVTDGILSFEGTGEFDEILFNPPVHKVTYYCESFKHRELIGFEVIIPSKIFNLYVRNRDLWYREYKGAKEI